MALESPVNDHCTRRFSKRYYQVVVFSASCEDGMTWREERKVTFSDT